MKEKENKSAEVQIKVIIEGECITAVLKDRDVPVTVEVVDVNKERLDYRLLSAYSKNLQADPSYMPCAYSVTDMTPNVLNTKIHYLYRDAGNFKIHNDCVIAGRISKEQIQSIIESLHEVLDFIPSAVGLPCVTFEDCGYDHDEDLDHPWFELEECDFCVTNQEPTVNITADELVDAFKRCSGRWLELALQ